MLYTMYTSRGEATEALAAPAEGDRNGSNPGPYGQYAVLFASNPEPTRRPAPELEWAFVR